MHRGIRDNSRKFRTRARTKDIDQIHADLVPEKRKALENQPVDPELPGCGQYYCIECAKYFIDGAAMDKHTKSKIHRRRLKELKDGPYTAKDAEAAVGLTTDNGIRNEEMMMNLQ